MKQNLDGYIEGVKTLPTTPGVMVRLISVFQQPEVDVDEVVELILQDPSLTAGLLRHANGAFSPPEEPIVDVFDAITWVGFSQVYQAVVAKLARQTLPSSDAACALNLDELWRHSAIAGVSAGAIARKVQENESLAFTAGLLHDIGKIVLALAEGMKYTSLLEKSGGRGAILQEAEEAVFGFTHAEVGARLLSRWGLPVKVFEPVQQHHQAEWPTQSGRICAIVTLSNLMAHAAQTNSPEAEYDSEAGAAAMRLLGLRPDDMTTLLNRAQPDIKRMTGLLGVGAN